MFDIFCLAYQLYQSTITFSQSSVSGKFYFQEIFLFDLRLNDMKVLLTQVEAFQRFIDKNKIQTTVVDGHSDRIKTPLRFHPKKLRSKFGIKEAVNQDFFWYIKDQV